MIETLIVQKVDGQTLNKLTPAMISWLCPTMKKEEKLMETIEELKRAT